MSVQLFRSTFMVFALLFMCIANLSIRVSTALAVVSVVLMCICLVIWWFLSLMNEYGEFDTVVVSDKWQLVLHFFTRKRGK